VRVFRLAATLALLGLGGLALARLPLDDLPRRGFPELAIGLQLPRPLGPGELGRRWLTEVEAAARALGGVRGIAGTVGESDAELSVRFTPGTDPELQAARLESRLAGLRRRLPAGAVLSLDPAAGGQGDRAAIVWLTRVGSDADAVAAAEELRAVPGVRAVDLFGARREELRLELRAAGSDGWEAAEAMRAEVARALAAPSLGLALRGERRLPVLGAPWPATGLAALPVPLATAAGGAGGAVPLGALATIRTRWAPPALGVRFGGAAARALLVRRSPGAPLLALDRALRRRLAALPGGIRGTVGWSAAAPLRALLGRLGLAALLATAAAAVLGWRLAGRRGALGLALAPAAALGAAANACWLAGVALDPTTLVALALGVAAALPLAALRLAVPGGGASGAAAATFAAAAVPVAVAVAGETLGPLLGEPARALLLAAAAAALAATLLPLPTAHRSRSTGRRAAAVERRALRDPGTVLLAAATAAALAAVLFGGALAPRRGSLAPTGYDLEIFLHLPAGSTLEETEARARQAEERLGAAAEVERFWSFLEPGTARLLAEVRAGERRPDRLTRLATRLRYQLGGLGAVEIASGAAPGREGFAADLEERPEVDAEGNLYRVVLRSTDLDALEAGYDRLLERLDGLKVRRHWVTGWGDPAVHLVLRPTGWTTPAEATALAAGLARRGSPPPALPLPDPSGRTRRALVVVPAGAPEDPDRVRQAAALLGAPLPVAGRAVVPAAAFRLAEERVHSRVERQAGRFVLPVEVHLPLASKEVRLEDRRQIDRSLGQLALPAGCDLERPPLGPAHWRGEQVRLVAAVVALPLLLFAVAACRLGSPPAALATLLPLALGLFAALPLVRAGRGQVDELTAFALAAGLALALPVVAEAAPAGAASGGRLYRALRRRSPALLAAAPGSALALALPTLTADAARLPWALPLAAAAVAAGIALASAPLLVPPLLLATARARTRNPEEARRRRLPPAWSEPGPASLAVRSLTKIYSSGMPALRRVDFDLGPGIVGLLGPNGAGKTTLLRLLTGLLEPTRGAVLFRGVAVAAGNLAEYRRRIGFLPQEFNAYPGFTAEQFLDHWALERGLADPSRRRDEVARWLAAVGLAEHAGRKVRDFSGGMRQRVGIARALLGAPPILIVDEPTTGLDVESRARFRQILLEQAAERIVVFSTHIASDVEAAASRLLLLHHGRLRFDGTPEALLARARGRAFRALVADADLAAFSRRYRVTARVRRLEGIEVRALARPGDTPAGPLVAPDLEEAYLAEIDRADVEAGRERVEERFAFLAAG
jgi:ABC-2 type transport system ATP-binding protein